MAAPCQILRVGLSGGIASGKTTVASFLKECGAYVVDADELARASLEIGGAAFEAVLERFGRSILDARGRIDRQALASLVFSDTASREALNAIIHPLVRADAEALFTVCARRCLSRLAVLDAALLVETGSYRDFDRLIIVSCSRETQLKRLLERGLSRTEAERRIDAQAPLEVKVQVADHVIENDGTLEETQRQTARVYASLLAGLDRPCA